MAGGGDHLDALIAEMKDRALFDGFVDAGNLGLFRLRADDAQSALLQRQICLDVVDMMVGGQDIVGVQPVRLIAARWAPPRARR
jgi:hypothetical protein